MCASRRLAKTGERKATGRLRQWACCNDRKRKYIKHIDFRLTHGASTGGNSSATCTTVQSIFEFAKIFQILVGR